ncbi:MAG: HD domain-containing protein [Dermatophilaceae bacterium]
MTAVAHAQEIAREQLRMLPRRWQHVQGVGRLAEDVASASGLADDLVAAAWLHDVGYAPGVADSSLHGLDGARFLLDLDAPIRVVSLVGHHTGAAFEAQERGLFEPTCEHPHAQPRRP